MMPDFLEADSAFINVTANLSIDLLTDEPSISRIVQAFRADFPDLGAPSIGASGEVHLESRGTSGPSSWISLERRRFSLGVVNPSEMREAFRLQIRMISAACRILPISESDCEALDLMFGFDLAYRGNHDELIARGLGLGPSLGTLIEVQGSRVIEFQPSVTIALDADCRTQCRLSVESGTTVSQVVSGTFSEEPLSVYFGIRSHRDPSGRMNLSHTLAELQTMGESTVRDTVIPRIVRPLRQAIFSS